MNSSCSPRSFDDSSRVSAFLLINITRSPPSESCIPWRSDAMQQPTADQPHRSAFLKILNQTSNPGSSSDISDNLKRLRRLVLTRGIPDDPVAGQDEDGTSIRARVWKLLLRIDRISAEDYLRWVDMGPSEVSAKSKLTTSTMALASRSFDHFGQSRTIPFEPWPPISASRAKSEKTCLSVYWKRLHGKTATMGHYRNIAVFLPMRTARRRRRGA